MSIEIGHFALALALVLGLLLGVLPLVGAHRRDARLMAVAQPAAIAQFIAILIAFATLIAGFVGNDFSVALIASHSNTDLPLELRIAATWGSHEGSMLLWSLMASGWTCAVAAFSRSLSPVLRARILGVLGLISVGFLLFLLFTSNPFERLLPPAVEGRDLNPLLQDPGMVFHPP
ncbi:MAG: cytochrome c biogenesis protein CcsA, partial [Burkholderiaceae bacterium]|nr:cytochrome c biogenesis protein CcsA [Burkholderiaceae bacterium]